MKQLIRSLKEEERFSTAHIYQSTLNAFMLFCKTDAIRFNQMERSRLKQFENHLRNKGCTWNTVSTYMRTLRSIYNKAVDDGLAEEKPPSFPSRIYRRKSQYQTCPRCQRHEQIIKRLPSTPPCRKAWKRAGHGLP